MVASNTIRGNMVKERHFLFSANIYRGFLPCNTIESPVLPFLGFGSHTYGMPSASSPEDHKQANALRPLHFTHSLLYSYYTIY